MIPMTLKTLIDKTNAVVAAVESGSMGQMGATAVLTSLYEQAWVEMPNSEPDGDIEYTIATAQDKISKILGVDDIIRKIKSEWLDFSPQLSKSGKTRIVTIVTKAMPYHKLGEIKWYGSWRKYALFTINDVILEPQCLRDITTMCELLTKEQPKFKSE